MADLDLTFRLLNLFLLAIAAVVAIAVVQVRSLFSATMLAGFYSLIMALIWQNMDAVDVSFTEAAVGAGISTILLLGALVVVGRSERERPDRINGPALLIVVLTGLALIYGTQDMPAYGDPQAPVHRLANYATQRIGKAEPIPGREGSDGFQRDWYHGPRWETPAWRGAAARELLGEIVEESAPPAAAGDPPQVDDGHSPPETEPHGSDHETGGHAAPDDDWDGHVPNTATSLLAGYRGFDTMFETAVIFTAGMGLVLLLRRRRDQDDPQLEQGGDDGQGAS